MADDRVLQTYNLGKRYKKRWAVRALDLDVRRGEVFGFLGPNGAGKSTTIRMLLSLVAPSEGEVLLFGKPLKKHREEVLARVGGLVERADFYLYLSARKNLEVVGALSGGIPAAEIDRVLELVGLHSRAGDKVKTFSHGMKQRLGIAQALLRSPEFVILDEPTTGLDPQGIKEVRELIRHISAEGITIFLSSHLLHEIEQTATSMAIINKGKLIVQGKVHELLNDGTNIVTIAVDDPDRAEALIAADPDVQRIRRTNGSLEVHMSAEEVGRLNVMLVQNGINVKALIPKRTLEDFFLRITENASEID